MAFETFDLSTRGRRFFQPLLTDRRSIFSHLPFFSLLSLPVSFSYLPLAYLLYPLLSVYLSVHSVFDELLSRYFLLNLKV